MDHKTRGSSADRELRCAGAIGYDGPRIDEAGDDAALGTAADYAMGLHVTGETVDIEAIAHDHGVGLGRLTAAYAGGVQVWREVGQWFPDTRIVQRRVDGDTTRGTADLVGLDGGGGERIAVLDWKLGGSDDRHTSQLKSYALALADEHRSNEIAVDWPIVAVEVHLLPARYWVHLFERPTLDLFRLRLEEQHRRAGRQFAPGDWCKFCPRKTDCPARDQSIAAAARALVEREDGGVAPRELLASLYDRSRQVSRAIKAYDAALRVALQDGPIPMGDGRELALKEETRETLDAAITSGALVAQGVDPAPAIKTTKSGIDDALRAHVAQAKAKGGKFVQSKARRAVLDTVAKAGGVETKTIQKIEVRDV